MPTMLLKWGVRLLGHRRVPEPCYDFGMSKQYVAASIALLLIASPMIASADQLSDLLAQIQALQNQITNARSSSAQSSGTTNSTCVALARNLARGAKGADVTRLQQFLISNGFLPQGSATGFFGAQTEKAVQGWQAKNGVASAGSGFGSVGPRTRAAIQGSCGGQSRSNVQIQVGKIPRNFLWTSGTLLPPLLYRLRPRTAFELRGVQLGYRRTRQRTHCCFDRLLH